MYSLVPTDELRDLKKGQDQLLAYMQALFANQPSPDAWLSNEDVCKLLKISLRKLQRLRDTGEIEFHRVGRKILYKRTEVEVIITKG
jgi:excisionase family DNA binding protein